MTGNQLTYAQNIETERHNRATEAEITRHNQATEANDANLADIERRKVTAQENYQQRTTDLQKEYNEWYMKYQTASTEEKLNIEKRLNWIREQQNMITEKYNDAQVLLGQESNAVKWGINAETRRHNEAMETVSTYQQLLNERRIEYENTFWRETIGYNSINAAINYLRTANDYEIAKGRLGLEEGREPYVRAELFHKGQKERGESYPFIKPLPVDEDDWGSNHPLSFSRYLSLFK